MANADDFMEQLIAAYKVEAEEHLGEIAAGLLDLEHAPVADRQRVVVETVYRAFHSLKGAARAVDSTGVEMLCQSAESVMASVKNGSLTLTPTLLDALLQVIDTMRPLVDNQHAVSMGELAQQCEHLDVLRMDASGVRCGAPAGLRAGEAQADIGSAPDVVASEPLPAPAPPTHGGMAPPAPRLPSPCGEMKQNAGSTVRISVDRLDSVLLQAEEMISAKLIAAQRAADLQEMQARLRHVEKEWAAIHPEIQRALQGRQAHARSTSSLDGVNPCVKLLDAIERRHQQLKSLVTDFSGLAQSAEADARSLGIRVDNLLHDTKKLLMLPCAAILQAFPKMVRDIAHALEKDVELVIEGSEVELDKRVLEKLKDPLMHLVRNCIDHGIEPPEVRERKGKSRRGTVRIAITQLDSSKVEVVVVDDGAGIDLSSLRAAAIRNGLLTPEAAETQDEQALTSLVFYSGLSTSAIITDISGRGLGMAIVQDHIEALDGQITLDTAIDVGTTIRIQLPTTHATFCGILIETAGRLFVMPTTHVERIWRLPKSDVKTVEGRETVALEGKPVSLVDLAALLELPPLADADERECIQTLVLGTGNGRIAFRVDRVLHEQEVLAKRLGKQLQRVRNIAGATVLGTGDVVPILNASDLVKSAVKTNASTAVARQAATPVARQQRASILVVEDSITSRMLIKNTLESAGYQVSVAVDGVDGLTALKSEAFDLVVTDVEMPRMDGFTLTETVRKDPQLAELPVILVTSLEAREHRERGIDVGANAYIVKSSFDQSNLLETVHRLI